MHVHRLCRPTVCTPNRGAYLAFGSCHLCKQSLGNFSTLHFLLNLVVNGSINAHGTALWFPIPLSGNSSCFHLQNILNMPVIYHWPNGFEASQSSSHFQIVKYSVGSSLCFQRPSFTCTDGDTHFCQIPHRDIVIKIYT